MATTTPLEERAAHLKAELEAVQQVQKVLTELRATFAAYPELRSAFAGEIALLVGELPTGLLDGAVLKLTEQRVVPRPEYVHRVIPENRTNAQRIVDFLKSKKEPATIRQIVEGTGIGIASVRHVLYVRNAELFRQANRSGRESWWQAATITDPIEALEPIPE